MEIKDCSAYELKLIINFKKCLEGFEKENKIEFLKSLYDDKIKEIKEEDEQKEIENIIKNHFNGKNKGNEFYDEINSVNASQIAQILIPEFPLNKNGKNFDNKKGGFTGYFYNRDTNSIVNVDSKYFNFGDSWDCYNSYTLIKKFKNWTDKNTFEFFKILLGKK